MHPPNDQKNGEFAIEPIYLTGRGFIYFFKESDKPSALVMQSNVSMFSE